MRPLLNEDSSVNMPPKRGGGPIGQSGSPDWGPVGPRAFSWPARVRRTGGIMAGRFGSVATAMVTPFKDDFSLDLERAQEIAAWLLDNGSDTLVVAGTTGEGATLSDEEKIDLWRATVEAAKGKGKIVAGTGTYDTAH